jgi:hypothetical protein
MKFAVRKWLENSPSISERTMVMGIIGVGNLQTLLTELPFALVENGHGET